MSRLKKLKEKQKKSSISLLTREEELELEFKDSIEFAYYEWGTRFPKNVLKDMKEIFFEVSKSLDTPKFTWEVCGYHDNNSNFCLTFHIEDFECWVNFSTESKDDYKVKLIDFRLHSKNYQKGLVFSDIKSVVNSVVGFMSNEQD